VISHLEKQPGDIAIWRFGVISPLLHRDVDGVPLYIAIERLAKTQFTFPGGRPVRYSADTLRHWLYLYRKQGLHGLRPTIRKDKGNTSLCLELQDNIITLRKQHPAWTIKRILGQLQTNGLWNGTVPSINSIYRFTSNHKLGRNPATPQKPVSSFEYPNFGDLWMADFLHGPKVRVGRIQKKAYLHLILDDATRYVVAANFHLAENTHSLISDLMLGVRRFGIPRRLYTDNGSAYKSRHLAHVAGKLGVALPHTPAYKPQGRGKVERIFRSIRDGFLTGFSTTTLGSLNRELDKWVGSYHSKTHSALGMSPLDKKLNTPNTLKTLDGVRDIDSLFRIEEYKTVSSNGCIRVKGRYYDVPESVPGQKVEVSYLPWDLSVVYITKDLIPIKPLDKIKNALLYVKPKSKRGSK
jgi:transposase InsO family protein